MTLLINACVRRESRTRQLAEYLLSRWDDPIEEVCLNEIRFPITDEAFLNKRTGLIDAGAFQDPMFDLARQFAEAKHIVIAAPYWDLSFPASLKQYIEQINVLGITFSYTPDGFPQGMCRAKELYYVSSAGGAFVPEEFGFGYIKALAENFYGIHSVHLIQATELDIDGADEEAILRRCKADIDSRF